VRQDIGAALYDVQKGTKPPQAKPFNLETAVEREKAV
jgi:hypothetical protein